MSSGKNKDKSKNEEEEKPKIVKCPADLQRLRLEKLMKNPDKAVVIPERPRERSMQTPPEFVRNVMGSSAGAGSGEFHVYRHLRRKEYARQKFIQEKSEKEKLDDEYHRKLEENKKASEDRTAKKRAKRLKKKEKMKNKPKKPKTDTNMGNIRNSSEEDDDETGDEDNDKDKGENGSDDEIENTNDKKHE